MRPGEDEPAGLDRARAEVTAWREQNRAGTADQLIAAIGSRFPPGYGPVLGAVLLSVDRAEPAEAGECLAVIAARLAAEDITCHLDRRGRALAVTAQAPGGAPDPVTVVIATGNGPGFWVDCTCTWTAPAATGPGGIAATVLAVMAAIRPAAATPAGPVPEPPDGAASTRRRTDE